MTIEVRRVTADELPGFFRTTSTAFLEPLDADAVAASVLRFWDLDRVWAAFEGSRIVGTFRSWSSELTLPGCRRLPASAVAGVTVLPTHRRRGILRALAAAEHAASRERGEPIAVLYASEYPIYGRFGYGPAVRRATWTLDALATGFVTPSPERIEYVQPADARDVLPEVFDEHRAGQPGEILRKAYRWPLELGLETFPAETPWRGYVALHRRPDGRPDGYVRYRAEERWEHRQPRNVLAVDELVATTDEAYAGLWRFLAEVDLVATVRAEQRRPGERLPWLLTNARAATVTDVGDGMWVNLLDVPRALAERAYESSARLVLAVVPPAGDGEPTRLELDATPEGATCRPTSAAPDLTVPRAALGAAYLGGTRLRDATIATGVDEHRAGALAEGDRLFRTAEEPWTATFF